MRMSADTTSVLQDSRKAAKRAHGLLRNVYERPVLYLLALPGLSFFILFKIIPSVGAVIAFQDFNIFKGIVRSDWVGLANFKALLEYSDFSRIFINSLILGVLKVGFTFPVPIVLALLLNELRPGAFQKISQTSLYLPHFLSWVVVSQLFINILSPQGGAVNGIIAALGGEPIFFMAKEAWFRPIFIISSIWKEAGYESIVYLAALASIPQEMYESASIDGANRFQQLVSITLPSLLPTVAVMFLLRIGQFLEVGFDQIWTLANPLVWSVADIFDTYVYRVGILGGAYSMSTAVSLFKSFLNLAFLLGGNALAKRLAGRGLF